jgi:hypothetical protein
MEAFEKGTVVNKQSRLTRLIDQIANCQFNQANLAPKVFLINPIHRQWLDWLDCRLSLAVIRGGDQGQRLGLGRLKWVFTPDFSIRQSVQLSQSDLLLKNKSTNRANHDLLITPIKPIRSPQID